MDAFSPVDFSIDTTPVGVQAATTVEDVVFVDGDDGSGPPGTYCVVA